jgi:hypothetical protein
LAAGPPNGTLSATFANGHLKTLCHSVAGCAPAATSRVAFPNWQEIEDGSARRARFDDLDRDKCTLDRSTETSAHATSDAANIEYWPESRAQAHVPFAATLSRQPGHFSRELGDFLGNRVAAKCLEMFRRTDHHLGHATSRMSRFLIDRILVPKFPAFFPN